MGRRALLAEFLGTLAYCFLGAGTAALGLGGWLGAAIVHGAVFAAWSRAFGSLSGGHLNPAITVASWAARRLDGVRALTYVAVQCLGGIAGACALAWVLGGAESGLGATSLAQGIGPVRGAMLEALLAFFVVAVFLRAEVADLADPTERRRSASGVGDAVGLMLVAGSLMGGPLTGAALNPARALGPAIASGRWGDPWHWLGIYGVGPVLGGLAAAVVYRTWLRPDRMV